jgi:diacylglycerol kinase family enzyme
MSNHRRAAAAAALILAGATVALAAALALVRFPLALICLAALPLALLVAWEGVRRRGAVRAVALLAALVLAAATVVLMVSRQPVLVALAIAAPVAAIAAASVAFRTRVALPAAPRPRHPVLFYNPRSGGGKAERFHVGDEARARGIEPVELTPGTDLEVLVREAVARGADALAMAGGDGSQAVVAAIAAETGLPYACIPAGTRNHFALDLGVDRDDVVGALDALVDGGERVVDLADVNGRVFVNNVSLGVYADAVEKEGYRDAKLRTLLETVPEAAGPHPADGESLHFVDGAGQEHHASAVVLVSNNRYRLGRAIGSGTRPRLDGGVLGVAVAERPLQEWTTPAFDLEAGHSVAAGIDGEAVRLDPPLRFRTRPAALRVRIARAHPGASPSALEPDRRWAGVQALAAIAAGRAPAGG